MIKFLKNSECLKRFTILLLCLLKSHSVLSACSDEEWDCDDGSCIPLQKKCDGIIDCKDRSDEIAENCIHLYRDCQDFAFTCTYGACITTTHRCNGIQDCSDNSDELVCPATWKKDLQGRCSEDELQCLRSKECIDKELICDGHRDCADGSDETVEVCAEYKCPEVGFHCGYGGCINEDARCNGTIECVDGSDEAWELCGTQRKTLANSTIRTKQPPTPTPTPTTTPKPKPKPPDGNGNESGCQIPWDTEDLIIKLHPENNTLQPGSWVMDSESIHFECKNRESITGSNSAFCFEGKFNTQFPTCLKYCDGTLLKGISTRYHCLRDGRYLNPRQCQTKIAPNTVVQIDCTTGYKRTGGNRQRLMCLPNGQFDLKREKCELECGVVQPFSLALSKNGIPVNPNDVPWHTSIFELVDNTYSFICGGSIISPSLIITAAHCFWDDLNKLHRSADNYQFIAGKYTREYSITADELPQVKDAVSIEISDQFLGKRNNNADVALVKLKDPLVFNDNISAVCMTLSVGAASDFVHSGISGFVTGYGERNTLEQVPMITRDYYNCSRDPLAQGLTDDKFCLMNNYDMSICRGDSGGGFVIKEGKDSPNSLLGIISYTPTPQLGCARNGFVSVTNVRYIKHDLRIIIQNERDNDELLF